MSSNERTFTNDGVLLDTEAIVSDPTTRYFLIKSYSNDNIGRSLQHGVWATSKRNEKVFKDAYKTSSYVVLIFSVNHSSRFSGLGVMTSEPGECGQQNKSIFCGPDGAPFFGKLFSVHWIANCEVFFRDCESILNGFNDNKPVKIGRDGQEIDPVAGKALCLLIDSKQPGHSRPTPLMVNNYSIATEDTLNLSGLQKLAIVAKYLKLGNSKILPNGAPKAQLNPQSEQNTYKWSLQWVEDEVLANTVLSIFPLDLTQFPSYNLYVRAYNNSKSFWEQLKKTNDTVPSLPCTLQFSSTEPIDAETLLQLFARSAPEHSIVRYLKRLFPPVEKPSIEYVVSKPKETPIRSFTQQLPRYQSYNVSQHIDMLQTPQANQVTSSEFRLTPYITYQQAQQNYLPPQSTNVQASSERFIDTILPTAVSENFYGSSNSLSSYLNNWNHVEHQLPNENGINEQELQYKTESSSRYSKRRRRYKNDSRSSSDSVSNSKTKDTSARDKPTYKQHRSNYHRHQHTNRKRKKKEHY